MCRIVVTIILIFVTFMAAELRAEVHTYVTQYGTGFSYGTDPASGNLYVTQTCGSHENFTKNNVSDSFTAADGTVGTAVFTCNGPATATPARYPLTSFSVVRCRVHFTKVGYLPIYRDFPFMESWIYAQNGSDKVLRWRFTSAVQFPDWEDLDDPFGDGGGGGDDDTDGDGTPDDEDDDDDNDGTPDVDDPDPKDPDVPDDPDDDPDDDPENDCTCGACCSCKCTCGNWSAVTCSGTCWHFGHGDAPMPPEVAGHYCECHHQDDGGDDGEDEPCCEHHAAIQAATERTATASESIDDKMDGIENQLSGINDKLTVTDPGHLTLPPLGGGVDVPLPSVPGISAPSLSLPEVGEVSEHPLTYFQRKGFGELPSFSYDILFEELSSKVENKFGLQSLSEKFQNPTAGNFDLSFTIDFQLPEPFNVHVGPHKVDVQEYVDNFAALPIANIIRLILLAYLGICFISAIVKIVFLTPW